MMDKKMMDLLTLLFIGGTFLSTLILGILQITLMIAKK